MEDLFRTLPKLMKELDDSVEVREAVVFAAWRKIAGKSLCEHSVPFRLFDKHLIVAVKDKMWKRHLEKELAGQMIFKLNSLLGQPMVTFIEFRVDEKTVYEQARKSRKLNISKKEFNDSALNEISPKLRNQANSIKDGNLRQQFLIAAGSYLAKKKRDGR